MPKNRSIFTIAADIVLNRGQVEKDSKKVGKALQSIGAKGKKAGKSAASGFSELNDLMPSVLKDFSSLGKTLTAGGLIAAVAALSVEIFNFSKGVNQAREEVKKFTQTTGKALDRLTGQVQGLSNAYNKDLNEVLQASNNLSRQFGITFEESLGLLEEGFVRGADASGELLSNIREYPTFFKEAGFSAGQLINIINQQVKQGIFSDKGVDSIKEFLLRVREMPKATEEALRAIGIDGKKMQEEIAKGTLSIQDAFVIVSQALQGLPEDSQKVGQVLADVFGGAGEDAGVSWITSFSEGFGTIEEVAKTSSQNIQSEFVDSGQRVSEEWARLFGDDSKIWTQFKTGFNNALANVIGGTRTLFDLFLRESSKLFGFQPSGPEVAPGGFVGPEQQGLPELLQPQKQEQSKAGLAALTRETQNLGMAIEGLSLQAGFAGAGIGPGEQDVQGGSIPGLPNADFITGEAQLVADSFYGLSDAFGAMIAGFASGENGLQIFLESFKRFALQMLAQMAALVAMSLLLNALLPGIGGASKIGAGLGQIFGIGQGSPIGGGAGFANIFKSLGGFGLGGNQGSLQGLPGTATVTGAGGIGGSKSAVVVEGRIRGEDIYLSNQRYEGNR